MTHKYRRLATLMILSVMMVCVSTGAALGQDGERREGRGERGDRGDRGDRRGQRDFESMSEEQREQMRERFAERLEQMRAEQAERMREDLELSEEEYAALEPMIAKVQQLTMESVVTTRNPFGRGGRGGRGGPGGGFGNPFEDESSRSPQAQALADASQALRDALDQEEPSSDQVKQRLASLREARIAMQAALRQAREELRGFLTPQQEAQLVLQGLLD